MQAHANDLRAEVADDWANLVAADQPAEPDDTALDEFVHRTVDDWRRAGVTPRLLRLHEFAEKITRRPSELARKDVEELRAVGWSDEAIHDAVQVVAYFNYINRIADALGVEMEADLPHWGRSAPSSE